jgi:Ca-activated chloride channel family protein
VQLLATLAFAALLTAGIAGGSAVLRPAPACQSVLIASSQEKFGILSTFAAMYDRTPHEVAGRCVSVTVEQVNSGDAEFALQRGWEGKPGRPDVWSPASSAWVNLLAFRPGFGAALLPPTYESLFQSPLVIGMPDDMATALGYLNRRIGWTDILKLVNDPRGWGLYRHPLWGKFLLGKTNPTVSTSGLHALIGTYFAATSESMTVATVDNPRVNAFVAGVESSVVHYSETATDFLRNLRHADDNAVALSYISAIAIEEKELVDYNNGIIGGVKHAAPQKPRVKLVAIYPSEGTPVADHPYVILTWSSAKARAAQSFYDYLLEPANQRAIDTAGFRNRNGKAGSQLGTQFSVNAHEPTRPLSSPDGSVLDRMLNQWQAIRKPARVLILVDVAADRTALSLATSLLGEAVSQFQARDLVGVWTFPGAASPYTVQREVLPGPDGLDTTLKSINPINQPHDLGPVVEAAIKAMDGSYDNRKVDAVLLVEMSPGKLSPADQDLEVFLEKQPTSRFVRLFTVGPAGNGRLSELAFAGQGFAYDPGTASRFLKDVISNF